MASVDQHTTFKCLMNLNSCRNCQLKNLGEDFQIKTILSFQIYLTIEIQTNDKIYFFCSCVKDIFESWEFENLCYALVINYIKPKPILILYFHKSKKNKAGPR